MTVERKMTKDDLIVKTDEWCPGKLDFLSASDKDLVCDTG